MGICIIIIINNISFHYTTFTQKLRRMGAKHGQFKFVKIHGYRIIWQNQHMDSANVCNKSNVSTAQLAVASRQEWRHLDQYQH